jgi:hypothetical protein
VGVGAQAAAVMSAGTQSILVQTKAEQELFDAAGRYNSTGGVELPLTSGTTQTTVPLNYTDSPTEFIGDSEVQIWKLVDNGFWSNSMHFDMVDVQLINRVGWDGTVKAPASTEVGWKDTLRLNPLEDVVVAMRAKHPAVPFGLPASIRNQDPSLPTGVANSTTQLPFLADPGVLSPQGASLLTTAVNTNVVVDNTRATSAPSALGYDNEFVWSTAILGHSEDDFQRPIVYHPTVTAPAVPTGLAGTGGALNWVDATPVGAAATIGNSANEVGFQVLRAPITGNTMGTYTQIATVPANATSYTDTTASGANSYEVVAFNNAGKATSTPWVEVSAPAIPTWPTPATNAVKINNNGTVQLTWNKVAGATNYVISSNGVVTTVPAAGGGGTTQNTTVTLPLGVNYTNITVASQLVFTGVTPNVTATSAASVAVSANLTAPAAPVAPTGLVLSGYTAQGTTAKLTWVDSVTAGVTGYVVQQSLDGGATWTQVGNILVANATTTNVTVANGNSYLYQVLAQSYLYAATNFTNSPASNQVSLLTTPLAPATVTGVAAAPASTTSIKVSWTASATNGATYIVQRKTGTGGGTFTTITPTITVNGSTLSFTDTSLTVGSTYTYQVQAVSTNTAGSTGSAFVASSAVSLAAPAAPAFAASSAISATGFTANWNAPTNATSYNVVVNGVAQPSQTTTSITVSGLSAGSSNTVTVAACSTGGVLCSTATSLTQATLPTVPVLAPATAVATTGLTLNWASVTGATGYTLQYSTNGGTSWTTVNAGGGGGGVKLAAALTGTSTSAAVTGLTGNTSYTFQLQATDAAGSSAHSTSVTQLTPPAVPTATASNGTTGAPITGGLAFTPVAGLTYTVTWTGNTGAPVAVTTSGQQITFTTAGTYSMTLTATNASGSVTSGAINVTVR